MAPPLRGTRASHSCPGRLRSGAASAPSRRAALFRGARGPRALVGCDLGLPVRPRCGDSDAGIRTRRIPAVGSFHRGARHPPRRDKLLDGAAAERAFRAAMKRSRTVFWADLTWEEIGQRIAAGRDAAMLPV